MANLHISGALTALTEEGKMVFRVDNPPKINLSIDSSHYFTYEYQRVQGRTYCEFIETLPQNWEVDDKTVISGVSIRQSNYGPLSGRVTENSALWTIEDWSYNPSTKVFTIHITRNTYQTTDDQGDVTVNISLLRLEI